MARLPRSITYENRQTYKTPLRVAIIGGSITQGGGASQVALDLVRTLNAAGHNATHLVATDGTPAPPPTQRAFYGSTTMQNRAESAEAKLRRFGLPHTMPLDLPALLAARLPRQFDLLHFHDLGPGMSPLTIRLLSRQLPTAWTFHDCAPFTGGCTYPMDCTRYQTKCGSNGGCPQLGHWPMGELHDFTGPLQTMRQRVHATKRIHAIAPSDWLADAALASNKLPTRPHVISNGVDLAIFQPARDRASLRRDLGLPNDRPIILLSAAIIADQRKGIAYALEALKSAADLNPFALIVGRADPSLRTALETIPHLITGHVADRSTLARWYAAADLQLNCSIAEVQGLVVLEAMACNVPTVGFASGGMPASIIQNESGYLVPTGDRAALTDALRHALQPNIAATWGQAARRRIETHFSLDRFRDDHIELYRAMLAAR